VAKRFKYSELFYNSVDERSITAATAVFDVLGGIMPVGSRVSIADIGCGPGTWANEAASKNFIASVVGLDLPSAIEVARARPNPARVNWVTADLCSEEANSLPLADGAVCTEVLEHLEKNCADSVFRRMLSTYGWIVFSAAQKGQGGTHHINERSLSYWSSKALEGGMLVFDPFREKMGQDSKVARYYATNLFLIAHPHNEIVIHLRNAGHLPCSGLQDTRTTAERIRYFLLSFVPHPIVTLLSRIIRN